MNIKDLIDQLEKRAEAYENRTIPTGAAFIVTSDPVMKIKAEQLRGLALELRVKGYFWRDP